MTKAQERAHQKMEEVHDAFAKQFGRSYGNGIYKTYKMEDADVAIFAMGSVASESRLAVDKLRKDGIKAGVVSLKAFRPFPVKYLREVMKDVKIVAVFDRDVGYGYEGVLAYELRAALYGLPNAPYVKGFIVGLGGRDILADHLSNGTKRAIDANAAGEEVNGKTEWLGLLLDQLTDVK